MSSTTPEAVATCDADIKLLPETIKGKADWRNYRSIQLPNGVRCTLVHDPESKTFAAAAVVDVGAGADPRSMPGVAHFVEHCLFLGSEKYPDENAYKSYLAGHGGRSNASTSMHTTTYKFDILADFAEPALDRFAQFFVAPLFTASGTSREVQAVDSENSKNLVADGRRRLQILKALADPSHYYSKFSTGNAVTLDTSDDDKLDQLRAALLAFHKKHYTPASLIVTVAGPQSLEVLQDMVVSKFSPLQARAFPTEVKDMTPIEYEIHTAAQELPNYAYYQPFPPYRAPFQPALQQASYGHGWPFVLVNKPLKALRKLDLLFQVPSDRENPDQSPVHILSHLLGHEGPGSSFAVLQNHGLLSSLVAGPRSSGPDFCLFHVEMNLTQEGEERWKEVADVIFAHCRLLSTTANAALKGDDDAFAELKRIWGEVAALRQIFFHQNSPGTVYDFAPSLVQSILVNGPDKCLSSGSMLNESEDTLPLERLVDFANLLVPSNCIIERCSNYAWDEMENSSKADKTIQKQTEQWYGIDYYTAQIEHDQIQTWKGATSTTTNGNGIDHSLLHLPKPNRYIPRSLELCPELPEEAKQGPRIDKEIDPPNLILTNHLGRLWHRLDDRYALPKSSLTLLWRNAAVENKLENGLWQHDAHTSVHSSLLSGMFAEHMAQETYDAELAGLYWGLSMTSSGIKLSCSGFSDRLSDLALKVMEEFVSGSFLKEPYLTNAKDRVVRNLTTYFQSRRSDSIAMYYRDLLIASNDLGIEASLEIAKGITLESATRQHERLMQNVQATMDCLYSGNVSSRQAEEFFVTASKLASASRTNAADPDPDTWIAAPLERQLLPGDMELHFPSNNPTEENGAVIVTYQSSIPGFKGEGMSTPESVHSSASIRLLTHILREPLFDELRTKQQLGYIVHSYYDLAFSSPAPVKSANKPLVTPVDSIVINVLSKKVAPTEVAERIDTFVDEFKTTLENTPESEIADHAKALSTKLLKPIQKLSTETNNHFGKIRRYGPEVFASGGSNEDLPWDNVKTLARAVEQLKREDLVKTWDRMVHPKSRSKITAHVYGSTHPLSSETRGSASARTIVDNLPNLMEAREKLYRFGDSSSARYKSIMQQLGSGRVATGAAVVALIGVGYVGLTMMNRNKRLGK